MRRLRPIVMTVSVVVPLLLAFGTAGAITPTPSPTPEVPCNAGNLQGGDVYAVGAIEVTLPEGSYALSYSPPGPIPSVTLCHLQTGAIVELRVDRCEEVRRVATATEAAAVVNAIVASCKVQATPTPQPPPYLCGGGESVAGSQTVTISDSIQVTLPEGEFLVLVNNDVAQICNPGEVYMLALRLSDCGRPDIEPPNAPAHELMAKIVASCVLLHPVTPVPTFPPLIEPGLITPPSTGSGGLIGEIR